MMRRTFSISAVVLSVSVVGLVAITGGFPGADSASAETAIRGEYLEARTCDVWTGPCFSNSEINLRGNQAVLAWVVSEGVFEGERLDGLTVAASVVTDGTLQTKSEGRSRAALYIDDRADAGQRKALAALAKKLAPDYLEEVVEIEDGKVSYRREGGLARLEVSTGGKDAPVLELATRPLSWHCDVVCGNEERAYPALSKSTRTECAKATSHSYSGRSLGTVWSDPGSRGAMVGSFEL